MVPRHGAEGLQICVVCGTPASAAALFCETCGYDYITGVRPSSVPGSRADASGRSVSRTSVAVDPLPPATVGHGLPSRGGVPGSVPAPRAVPVASNESARWVAEVWIDPDWHAAQGGPHQLPSPGQPVIIGLRKNTVVIGRTTSAGKVDIDLSTDSGVSRRQASLVTDGRRWFGEDLGSSNGTFVSRVDTGVASTPIQGRVEITHHDRIHVGSWTRIVVRPALMQESGL